MYWEETEDVCMRRSAAANEQINKTIDNKCIIVER